jgi:quinohemoprotein ethanol dehydrogenase
MGRTLSARAVLVFASTVLATALLSCVSTTYRFPAPVPRVADVDDVRLAHPELEPQNWITHGGNWQEHRFSILSQINTDNVSQLKPAWSFDYDTTRGQESTPLVIDGVMYVTTAWSKVYALDAKTGTQLWFFDPKVPGAAGVPTCCDIVNRGVAAYHGNLYLGTIDGRLIALDAASGRQVWSTATTAPGTVYSITGAPRVAHGKVFIGNAGAEFGGRGYVSAYNAENGKLVWRFYTVPGDPAAKPDRAASDEALARVAQPTWFGNWFKYGGGGHVWNALVYDPDFNQVYMATGNGYPWNRTHRSAGKGDNLFLASIVAVDADTGRYKWHYQEVPGEEWDYDSVSDMALIDARIGGETRKVLLHAPKDGFFYVLDRKSGKLLSAEPFIANINWATHVDLPTGRPDIVAAARYETAPFLGVPGGGGAHNWHPWSYSPAAGLIYIPATESSTFYQALPDFEYVPGIPHIGINRDAMIHGPETTAAQPATTPGAAYLLGWDPVANREVWRQAGRGNGLLSTAGNLVFQGRTRSGLLGELIAFRADNGTRLWSYDTPNAIAAGPVSYSVAGEQYIAVSSGASALSFGAAARVRHPGRMLAFKLNGTATLPPEPPLAPPPPNLPQMVASPEALSVGKARYDLYCARCHGFDTVSANVIPDLRRSPMLADKDAWHTVVIDGVLAERGMVSWAQYLTADDAEAVRAYVAAQARALFPAEPTPSAR